MLLLLRRHAIHQAYVVVLIERKSTLVEQSVPKPGHASVAVTEHCVHHTSALANFPMPTSMLLSLGSQAFSFLLNSRVVTPFASPDESSSTFWMSSIGGMALAVAKRSCNAHSYWLTMCYVTKSQSHFQVSLSVRGIDPSNHYIRLGHLSCWRETQTNPSGCRNFSGERDGLVRPIHFPAEKVVVCYIKVLVAVVATGTRPRMVAIARA